jgi:hypothetical protein
MSGLEGEDHTVTQAEHEFYKAFVTVLEHLKNRALRAEAEVRRLRHELDVRREQVEYFEKPVWPEVTAEQAANIDKALIPEFALGDWVTVESEKS